MTSEHNKRPLKTAVKPGQLRVWREAYGFECTYLVVRREEDTTRWITLIVESNEARLSRRAHQLMDDNQCRGDELVCDA